MIEPTDDMVAAFYDQLCGGFVTPEEARAGLAAVLAIVARDHCMERRGHVYHPLAAPPPVEHRMGGDEIVWNPATEEHEAECVCGETFSGWLRATAEERLLIHLERETGRG